jgi:hypothetical protein
MVLGGRCVSGADIPGLMQKRLGRAQPSSVAGRGGFGMTKSVSFKPIYSFVRGSQSDR